MRHARHKVLVTMEHEATRYMAVIKLLGVAAGEDANDWKTLRELCSDVVVLRKGDHSAERLKLERERVRLGLG